MADRDFTRRFSNSALNFSPMKLNILALSLLAVLCLGCGGSTANNKAPALPSAQSAVSASPFVVFAGDSILGSEGSTLQNDYQDANYFDAGVYGYSSSRLLEIFPDLLAGNPVCYGFVSDPEPPYPDGLSCAILPQAPGKIVVYVGWNDIFSISPPSTALVESTFAKTISNLDAMIALAHKAGVRMVICTLYHSDPAFRFPWSPNDPDPFGPWTSELNREIRMLALTRGVPMADLEIAFSDQSGYTVDGTHPNAAGFALMKNTIHPVLESLQ
jgi:GDSL-like Lipase/Acylhydrolase family